jgi:hypothetical protein
VGGRQVDAPKLFQSGVGFADRHDVAIARHNPRDGARFADLQVVECDGRISGRIGDPRGDLLSARLGGQRRGAPDAEEEEAVQFDR